MCHKQYQNGNDHHVQHHDDGVIIIFFMICVENDVLVGGFNPSEKYESQLG